MYGPRHFGGERKREKLPRPKNIKEVPNFIRLVIKRAFKVVRGFFSRLLYIFGLVWETRPWILFAMLVLAVIEGVLPVVKAFVGAEILNQLAAAYTAHQNGTSFDFWRIMRPLIIEFALIFATSLSSNIDSLVTRIAGELVRNTVKLRIMKKAKTVDMQSFDKPEFYEKLENASREADSRPIQIVSATFSTVTTVISIVSFVIILWGISPIAPFAIAALSLPGAIITFVYRKKVFSFVRMRSKDRRQLAYYSDVMTNKDIAKEVRIFGLADFFTDKYKGTFKKYFSGLKRLYIGEGAWNTGFAVVSAVANCLLFLFVAQGVYSGSFEVGHYSLYTGALNSIASGLRTLVHSTATIYEGTLFIDNLISFVKEPQTLVPLTETPASPERHIGHKIEFCDVSFRYPGADRDTIKHFSATISPGDTVVLVGLNGAGKTTLIKLLTRLYDPTDGKIMLDGRDIREYDTAELYKIFGIIFQDFGKYALTVEENIALSDTDAPIQRPHVELSAKQGSADGFINALPNKYDTPLTKYFEETGTELSIGQWQKLSVARAFYSDSDILILDEPTASLDAIAEQEIYDQFDSLRKDKTTIFVSHRLSSATVADKILVIDDGCLIEQGKHSELMKLGGKYAELFSTQAKRYMQSDGDDGETEETQKEINDENGNTALYIEE